MSEPGQISDEERDMDEALEDSFPASDPPSASSPATNVGGEGTPTQPPEKS